MGLDNVGRRYKKFQRTMHETWLGLKIIFYGILAVAAVIFVIYVAVSSR